jgi:hypothetical protein
MNVAFLEETEICERSLRRLAQSRSCPISKCGSEYIVEGVSLCDDEAWAVLSAMPQTHTLGGRNRPVV